LTKRSLLPIYKLKITRFIDTAIQVTMSATVHLHKARAKEVRRSTPVGGDDQHHGIEELSASLHHRGWKKETSYWPDRWIEDRPETGQCAVTALLVQDHFGGEIIEADTDDGEAHFYNVIPGIGDVDLTRNQFDPTVKMQRRGIADRKDILSFPDTVRRYLLLKNAVQDQT
jgi:hypothetical protein